MKAKDDYLIVLDFLPRGKGTDIKPVPLAQGIGDTYFNLLEAVVKEGVKLEIKERVYIGAEQRDKIKYVRGLIKYDQLTTLAKDVLEEVLEELIEKNENRFIEFFNKAGPLTTRMHSLELIPGIGKKHLWVIIKERKKRKFESFEDLKKRIEMLPDPKRIIKKRILMELRNADRHKLFVGVKF